MSQAVKVGIFAFVALVLLGWLILRIEDIRLFEPPGERLAADFDSVAGLDDKAAVRIAGVRVGQVDGIALEDRQAVVTLALDTPVTLT
jgi:phospholipid/cholesterol/gamma-HCH transport system substrate-binding protein